MTKILQDPLIRKHAESFIKAMHIIKAQSPSSVAIMYNVDLKHVNEIYDQVEATLSKKDQCLTFSADMGSVVTV